MTGRGETAIRIEALVALAMLAAACGAGIPSVARDPVVPVASPSSAAAAGTTSLRPAGSALMNTPAPSPSPAVAGCTMWQLAISVVMTSSRHAAGSTYYPIEFINDSTEPCILADPDFAFRGPDDAVIGPEFTAGVEPPTTLVLAPTEAAHAQLRLSNADLYDPAACKPVSASTVRWLRVTVPGQPKSSPDPLPLRVLEAPFTPDPDVCSGGQNASVLPLELGRWLP